MTDKKKKRKVNRVNPCFLVCLEQKSLILKVELILVGLKSTFFKVKLRVL